MTNPSHRRFGSIRRLPSGRYQAHWEGADGHRHKAPHTFADRPEAELWLAQVRVERAAAVWIDERDGAMPISAVAEAWQANLNHLRPSSLARNLFYLRRYILADPIAARPVGTVLPSEISGWVSRLAAARLSAATIAKAVQILAAIFDVAIADRRRADNPARGRKLPKIEPQEMATLGVDEIVALADVIDARYRPLVIFACHTGLRMGELVALTAADVDPLRRRVRVTRNTVEVSGCHHHGPVKTRAGWRNVPLDDAALAAITGLVGSAHHPDDLLFTSPAGGFLRLSTFRKRFWRPATAAIGRPELRLHDMRHTAITHWMAAGVDPKSIAEWAGHRSVVTVLDRYGHARPDMVDAALERINAHHGAVSARRAARRAVSRLRDGPA